jgi:hypothetical protein
MKNLDGKAAGSGEAEGRGPVQVLGFLPGCIPSVFKPIVDIIDLVVRILHEAKG